MGWKIKRNDFPEIARKLPLLMDETTAYAADQLAAKANELAPDAQSGAQFSSGALSVSYYGAGAHFNGYEAALSEAESANDGAGNKALDEETIAPKLEAPKTPGTARAYATSCLNYAYAVEFGFFVGRPGFWFGGQFYPVKSPGHNVPGRPHFFPAVDKTAPLFFKQLARDLKSLETIKAPRFSPQEREKREAERGRAQIERDHRRGITEFKRDQHSINANLLGETGQETRRVINATRTTKTGKRYRETFSERAQRLREATDEKRINQGF